MNQLRLFFLFVVKILILLVVVSVTLDLIYTVTYTKILNTSKFHYIKNQRNKSFDHIFIGSSRVVNHVIPQVVDSCLGTNSANFGIMDAQPKDILTLLKLIKHYQIKFDSAFIQTDYYYNSFESSKFLYADMIPFIKENHIISSYYKDEKDYYLLYYVPFYKYCKNDAKLGIRELLASFTRENAYEKTKGYSPLFGFGNKWQRELPTQIQHNNYNKKTVDFLNTTKANYRFFVAPLRGDTKNLHFTSLLKKELPTLWDFSKSIKEENKFKNGYHLNNIGAKEFSIQLADSINLQNKL